MSLIADFMARKDIDKMGLELARQFQSRLPVDRSHDQKRLTAEFDITLGHARGMVRSKKLGTYGKSRIANSFQWALVESGYERSVAMGLGRDLASRLAEDRGGPA